MKKNIFLHIGIHKTGTTFLQTKIFNKIPIIDKNYFFFKRKYKKKNSEDFFAYEIFNFL